MCETELDAPAPTPAEASYKAGSRGRGGSGGGSGGGGGGGGRGGVEGGVKEEGSTFDAEVSPPPPSTQPEPPPPPPPQQQQQQQQSVHNSAGATAEAAEAATKRIFKRVYATPTTRGGAVFEEVVAELEALSRQGDAEPRGAAAETLRTVLHDLFDEYRYLHAYPPRELEITGTLFGMLVQRRVIPDSPALGVALRYILNALHDRERSGAGEGLILNVFQGRLKAGVGHLPRSRCRNGCRHWR